ncbi:hypothetical protein MLPF_1519 [Mycobacterium lepromatosis]|nr:hypothetical protein MLPF_1519 [Mycobacterium lepromatosis]
MAGGVDANVRLSVLISFRCAQISRLGMRLVVAVQPKQTTKPVDFHSLPGRRRPQHVVCWCHQPAVLITYLAVADHRTEPLGTLGAVSERAHIVSSV